MNYKTMPLIILIALLITNQVWAGLVKINTRPKGANLYLVKDGKKVCVEIFNKAAGSSMKVARSIVRNLDSGREVVTPTFKAGLWYFMRYFGWVVDLVMKNILGPKELEHIGQTNIEEKYAKGGDM